jgi:hypothetical protein
MASSQSLQVESETVNEERTLSTDVADSFIHSVTVPHLTTYRLSSSNTTVFRLIKSLIYADIFCSFFFFWS